MWGESAEWKIDRQTIYEREVGRERDRERDGQRMGWKYISERQKERGEGYIWCNIDRYQIDGGANR